MYINGLTNDERHILLTELEKYASDETLVAAVEETQFTRAKLRSSVAEFKKKRTTIESTVSATTTVTNVVDIESKNPPEKKNVEPPGTAAQRVVTSTIEKITKCLKHGPEPLSSINTFIKGREDNTKAVLKLLWQRKLIEFDGSEYCLP